MSNKALIVIDIQNDYFENGAIPLHKPIEASLNAAKIINDFRVKKLPIAHIQHISSNPELMPIFIDGTNGVEIHDNVKTIR